MITNNLKKIVTFAGGLNNAYYYWGYSQNFTLKNFDNTDTEFYKIDKPTPSDGGIMTRILSGLSGKATSKDLEYLIYPEGQGVFFRVGTGKSAETVDDYNSIVKKMNNLTTKEEFNKHINDYDIHNPHPVYEKLRDRVEKIEANLTGPTGEKGDKGERGEKGDTPVKGVDYFTDSDIDDIVEKMLICINGNGVAY